MNFLKKILRNFIQNKNEKDLNEINKSLEKINNIAKNISLLSNDDLRNKTKIFKIIINDNIKDLIYEFNNISSDLKKNQNLNIQNSKIDYINQLKQEIYNKEQKVLTEILPDAFAVVKETAIRFSKNQNIIVNATKLDKQLIKKNKPYIVWYGNNKVLWKNVWQVSGKSIIWNMIHYDVQLMGGIVLHQGKIAEMATGEGKTLVATLPIYLNALTGRGVHIVTVNDYLSKRDTEWMSPIMEFLGLSVDCIDNYPPNTIMRKNAYQADITYGTNNEFGFDYLRDNITNFCEEVVQRELNYAIVDEVDSVLIDEARTPLIISGSTNQYYINDFNFFKPKVELLIKKQKIKVTKLLKEVKEIINNENNKNLGYKILQLYRGLPKYKPIIKFFSEKNIRTILKYTEYKYMQENQNKMYEIDQDLYFVIDEKNNTIEFTDKGIKFFSESIKDHNFFILPDINSEIIELENMFLSDDVKQQKKEKILQNFSLKSKRLHIVNQLLKAYTLFERDVDYVIINNKVKIVDEQTGRIMEGRRYSEGLHQALESKENVKIESSTETLASITLQNYFRMYHKLSGMTGTAETESEEFWKIYKLDVVVIPTHKSINRIDYQDLVFKTMQEKYSAIIDKIIFLSKKNKRPVLVGTTSVVVSELISRMLKMKNITHNVLNAKLHKKEADIIAEAGITSMITIATNMAGRGTDIKLSKEVKKSGGLAIIGTERHDSRRIDRQLRGRAGRQGDPGSSQFYVSLEDNLMRLFIGSNRLAKLMDRFGHKKGDVIQHPLVSKSIERAQKKVEENNFSIRKRLLEYDDVMNKQRHVIYTRRKNTLFGTNLKFEIEYILYNIINNILNINPIDYEVINNFLFKIFNINININKQDLLLKNKLLNKIYKIIINNYSLRKKYFISIINHIINNIYSYINYTNNEKIKIPFISNNKTISITCEIEKLKDNISLIHHLEKYIILYFIDENWKEHLRQMEDLRYSVQNVIYEQKDPILVYKKEAYHIFYKTINKIDNEIAFFLFNADISSEFKNFYNFLKQNIYKNIK